MAVPDFQIALLLNIGVSVGFEGIVYRPVNIYIYIYANLIHFSFIRHLPIDLRIFLSLTN